MFVKERTDYPAIEIKEIKLAEHVNDCRRLDMKRGPSNRSKFHHELQQQDLRLDRKRVSAGNHMFNHILVFVDRFWHQQSSLAEFEFDSSLYHGGVQIFCTK